MKKYKLTEETKEYYGVILHRIEALRDFGYVKSGDRGGFIEKESNLSHAGDAWVFENASILGNASVSGNALISGNTSIYGKARVSGDTFVSGDGLVYS
jgi:hypothetical protein